MANPYKKCSICKRRTRGTDCISLTPSPYKIGENVEICVTIQPQNPTRLCNKCLYKLKRIIDDAMFNCLLENIYNP